MNKIMLISMITILLSSCSQKMTSSTKECQNIEREMLDLKQEKSLNITAVVVAKSYPYAKDTHKLEQKIKVLNMQFEECKRK